MKEVPIGNGIPINKQSLPNKVLIRQHQSPGDVLVLSAAIESLAIQFPGRFKFKVESTCPDVWLNNPHVDQSLINSECHIIQAEYNLINRIGNLQAHFIDGFIEDIGPKLGVPLKAQTNRPHLYLTEEEKKPVIDGPYALINAGYKTDFTCKHPGSETYQEIVDTFKEKIRFIQIGHESDIHDPLWGIENLVGQTTPRELIRLAYGSLFGVGPVTFLHHIYGALSKPYICFIGGREPTTWESYPTATMLSTQGQLPCCKETACWRSRTVPLNDGDKKDTSLCALPVLVGDEMVPKCMAMIGSGPACWSIRNMLMTGVIKFNIDEDK